MQESGKLRGTYCKEYCVCLPTSFQFFPFGQIKCCGTKMCYGQLWDATKRVKTGKICSTTGMNTCKSFHSTEQYVLNIPIKQVSITLFIHTLLISIYLVTNAYTLRIHPRYSAIHPFIYAVYIASTKHLLSTYCNW